MSYDLMVFEASSAPRERAAFLAWYDRQTQWSEAHDYGDPSVSSPALRAWYMEMIESFPALNGPYASEDEEGQRLTEYCVGKDVIYACFGWSQVEPAFQAVAALAKKHRVGFFDVSEEEGAIVFPDEPDGLSDP